MVSRDGYRVEPVMLQRSLRRPPRQFLRVTWRGYFVSDAPRSRRSPGTSTSPR
jgi:hypothetical protein